MSVVTENQPAHSHIGASSFYRWSECPGSVRLSKGLPNKASKYAEEGTLAHEHAAYRLEMGYWRKDIEPEMQDALQPYTTLIEYDKREAGSRALSGIEHKFDLSKIHEGLFGTCDAWIYSPEKKLLTVYDLKYGAGVPVEVMEGGKGNPQLMYYGLGALVSLNLLVDEVELVIVQPRCNHKDGTIRRWRCSAMDLLDFAADLDAFATLTEDPNAFLKPSVGGKDYCRWCPAAAVCPALKQKAQELAALEFGAVPIVKDDLDFSLEPGAINYVKNVTQETLSEVLHWLPTLESWIKSVWEFAYAEANHGKTIPGWKLVEGRKSNRKWADEVKIAQFLESEFAQTSREFFETKIKSPAAIEKILHKNQHEKLKPFIAPQAVGAPSLVPESDPRPAIVILDAKSEFSVIDEEAESLI